MKLLVRPKFYEDITREEIYLLEHAGEETADRWHESLWRTIEFLATQPLVGRARTDLKFTGIRSWRVDDFERWLVFYGVRRNDLILFRVVSGTTNLYALTFE